MRTSLIIGILFWSFGVSAQETNRQLLERLMTRNRYQAVLKCIDSLRGKGVKFSDMLFYEGKANEGVLRYKEALRCYSDWLRLDSTNREARLAMARVAALSGRTTKALEIYEKLVGEDSLDFFVNYQLARLYQQSGKLNPAIQVYERLYQADTTNAALLKRLGDCYSRMGWNMNAVDYYEDAFRFDPADGEVVVKAVNLMMANQALFPDFINQGMKLVDTALVYSPRLTTLKQMRGILLYLKRRLSECEDIFKELLVQGDSTRLNFKYLGLALFHMNRFKEAVEPLKRADSLFRDGAGNRIDFDLSMRYGENLGKCEEKQKALKVFEEIEQQMMPDTATLYQLAVLSGKACEQVDDRKQAVRNYWKAYCFKPSNKNIIRNLVSFHYGLWTEKDKRRQASEKEVSEALFFHILFLQKNKELVRGSKYSYHTLSKDILQRELDEMFFKQEKQMTVIDPHGKKYTYSAEEIRELIKSSDASAAKFP